MKELHQAIEDSDLDRVQSLLSSGASCLESNKSQHSALQIACRVGCSSIVTLIFEQVKFISIADFYIALLHKNYHICDLLILYGFDINTRFYNNLSLLDMARRRNDEDGIDYLIARGCLTI